MCKLACDMRTELKIMNTLYVHDIIKAYVIRRKQAYVDKLACDMRTEPKIMNMLFVHDLLSC
jgi:hypothetical protein